MTLWIARHEFSALFKTRLGWFMLAAVQLAMGIGLFFLMRVYKIKLHYAATLAKGPTYEIIVLFFALTLYFVLLLVPALTTWSVTLQRRNGSLLFLLTKPVSMTQLVLGKFLGLLMFLLCMLALMLLTAAGVMPGGNIDLGTVFSAWSGTVLAVLAYCAIALFLSSLTTQPVIALLSATFVLLFFVFIEIFASLKVGWIEQLIQFVSLLGHLDLPTAGLWSSVDLLYFVLVTVFFLYLTVLRFQRFSRSSVVSNAG